HHGPGVRGPGRAGAAVSGVDPGGGGGQGRPVEAGRAGRGRGQAVRRTADRLLAGPVAAARVRRDRGRAERRSQPRPQPRSPFRTLDLMATYVGGVTLFDGRSVRRKAGVLVDGGTVGWVGPHARAPRAARAAAPVDGAGRLLTPGLIDCHVHLCFDGGADFVEEARVTEPYAAIKCAGTGERQLAAGVP